jgi:hypothetical protein
MKLALYIEGQMLRRWEQGDRPLNPVAAYAIGMMLDAIGAREQLGAGNA